MKHRRVLCIGLDKIKFHCARLAASPSAGEKDNESDGDNDRQSSQPASNAGTNLFFAVTQISDWSTMH